MVKLDYYVLYLAQSLVYNVCTIDWNYFNLHSVRHSGWVVVKDGESVAQSGKHIRSRAERDILMRIERKQKTPRPLCWLRSKFEFSNCLDLSLKNIAICSSMVALTRK